MYGPVTAWRSQSIQAASSRSSRAPGRTRIPSDLTRRRLPIALSDHAQAAEFVRETPAGRIGGPQTMSEGLAPCESMLLYLIAPDCAVFTFGSPPGGADSGTRTRGCGGGVVGRKQRELLDGSLGFVHGCGHLERWLVGEAVSVLQRIDQASDPVLVRTAQ